MVLEIVIVIVVIALFFDFVNGFHDTSNAISTIVATGTLKPVYAVALAAVGNFLGVFLFPPLVATTMGKGIITESSIAAITILAALLGAIIWGLITWYLAIPSSSSHALIGGLLGAALVYTGPSAIIAPSITDVEILMEFMFIGGLLGLFIIFITGAAKHERLTPGFLAIGFITGAIIAIIIAIATKAVHVSGLFAAIIFIAASPLIGMGLSFIIVSLITRGLRRTSGPKANRYFRRLQIGSSFFYSLSHGTNDAQKTMGVITILLVSEGILTSFHIPLWVILAAGGAMALGTFLGGWRIVKTMAARITALRPYQGFSAETGGGVGLTTMAIMGIPVSTTHAIAGSIMGVGAARGTRAVRWGVTRRLIIAWIITIPASALMAAVICYALSFVM